MDCSAAVNDSPSGSSTNTFDHTVVGAATDAIATILVRPGVDMVYEKAEYDAMIEQCRQEARKLGYAPKGK